MLQTFLKLHYFVCCTKLKRHLHTPPLCMRDVYSWRFYSVHLQTTKADDVSESNGCQVIIADYRENN